MIELYKATAEMRSGPETKPGLFKTYQTTGRIRCEFLVDKVTCGAVMLPRRLYEALLPIVRPT